MWKLLKLCEVCKTEFKNKPNKKCCSKECNDINNTKLFKCSFCGELFRRVAYGKTKYEMCGASCRGKYARSCNNPMHNQESVNKMKNTLKVIGHKPIVQGGNGKGLSKPQELLFGVLGNDWVCEYSQSLKGERHKGYPSHYKIDIANVKNKIAIEVDGNSHNAISRKTQDKKKEAKLVELGWKVIRFKNKEILNDLEGCVRKICVLMG